MNVLFHNNNNNNNNNNTNQKSNNKILINEKMKSKSLQSIEPTTNNYASISDEKINDIIFIEETPKFRMINQKLLHESKESLPIITSRNNNSNQDQNDSHTHIKYNYIGSNSNYQDQSLLAVYSMSNNGFKPQSPTNSRNPSKSGRQNKSNSPTSYQLSSSPSKNHSSAFVLNTTKAMHMVERSSSKYGTNPNSSHSSRKNNSQLSTNEVKKYIPGRSVLNQTSPTPSIMSIVKPIMSNVFISPNSASNNTINNISNTNISLSNNANTHFNNANSTSQLNIKGQDASKLTSRLNKSGILRNELNQKSPTLPSPNQQQQPPMSPQQQNLYNITSNNTKSAAFVNNVNESTTSNLNNKSSIMMTREKTNLSSYFTNLMNSQLNSSKRVNTSKQNGQHTPPKINYSRNELNSSINSTHNNTFGSLTKSNIPKHSNSFNYKLNIAVHTSQTPTTPTARNNIDNDIITGIGFKSASRQKITTEYPYNERNESRLLETTIQEVAIDEQSENENDYDNVMNSSKYQNARKQQQQISSKMRTVDKQLLIKQTNINTNQQSSLPFHRKNSNENNNNNNSNLHFDESLNFETEEERKYKSINTSRMMHHSRTSIKDTTIKDNSKIFGSLIMTSSKSMSNNHNSSTNNINNNNNKRHDSAKSFISRDINDSYAYNDVKKYIEENDLMPPDRAEAIKSWIKEVNSCLKDLEQTVY